jgi:hypothetical protein
MIADSRGAADGIRDETLAVGWDDQRGLLGFA